jgi:hypothetical protein
MCLCSVLYIFVHGYICFYCSECCISVYSLLYSDSIILEQFSLMKTLHCSKAMNQ